MWHGINDLYRSFAPREYATALARADYSHFYGPISWMVFDHFEGPPFAGRLVSVDVDGVRDRVLSLLFSDLSGYKERPGPLRGANRGSRLFEPRAPSTQHGFAREG